MGKQAYLRLIAFACILGLAVTFWANDPAYTDAFYYYNAGAALADGDGLTDYALWMYLNPPDELPAPSHRYWMPLASIVAAIPMTFLGVGQDVAQLGFIPFWAGLACLGMFLGHHLGGRARHGWIAGLCILAGGFYLPFWLAIDTFALFGMVGAGALIALGLGKRDDNFRWFALAGALGGLAHLARADGVLFIIVGLIVIFWPPKHIRRPLIHSAALVGAYLLVMSPWFVRNMQVIGAPLPAGGVGTAFLQGYNDLFSYPVDWSWQSFMAWGGENILRSRWEGTLIAFQTWLAVEGAVFFGPLALVALWKRRRDAFLAPMLWYAVGLHVAMALVFTYPGARGGLFHSSSALLPFWMALGLVGLDDVVAWFGRLRRWRIAQAQNFFGIMALLLPLMLGLSTWRGQMQGWGGKPNFYQTYAKSLPEGARVMVNDPSAWYYYTGHVGTVLPDESLTTAYEIAQRYCITHLIIDRNITDSFIPLLQGDTLPPFLTEQAHFLGQDERLWSDDVRIFTFDVACTP